MGSWKLEVNRMFVYVFFPVGMFHLFNQPQIFEEWVVKEKRDKYPRLTAEKTEKFENLKLEHQKRYDEKKKAEAEKLR